MGPSDCSLFGPLKCQSGEIAFQQIDMKQAVTSWLQVLDTDFTL